MILDHLHPYKSCCTDLRSKCRGWDFQPPVYCTGAYFVCAKAIVRRAFEPTKALLWLAVASSHRDLNQGLRLPCRIFCESRPDYRTPACVRAFPFRAQCSKICKLAAYLSLIVYCFIGSHLRHDFFCSSELLFIINRYPAL